MNDEVHYINLVKLNLMWLSYKSKDSFNFLQTYRETGFTSARIAAIVIASVFDVIPKCRE